MYVVAKTIQSLGLTVIYYSITDTFEIHDAIEIQNNDIIIIANYYGLCCSQIEKVLSHFPKNSVIVDSSQAYFQTPFDCLATIYSPRKFIPVPDGGIVNTDLRLCQKEPDEISSFVRYRCLVESVVGGPESSRDLYLESESQLNLPSLRTMSAFTRRLLEIVDTNFIKLRRISNWKKLDTTLSQYNQLNFALGDQIPLCYPLMLKHDANLIRDSLCKFRIYLPRYWPGITCNNSHEQRLLNNTLFLPIDHRYNDQDMNRLLDSLLDYVK